MVSAISRCGYLWPNRKCRQVLLSEPVSWGLTVPLGYLEFPLEAVNLVTQEVSVVDFRLIRGSETGLKFLSFSQYFLCRCWQGGCPHLAANYSDEHFN